MNDLRKEYDTRVNEYAQMLDLRAERIKVLKNVCLLIIMVYMIMAYCFV